MSDCINDFHKKLNISAWTAQRHNKTIRVLVQLLQALVFYVSKVEKLTF